MVTCAGCPSTGFARAIPAGTFDATLRVRIQRSSVPPSIRHAKRRRSPEGNAAVAGLPGNYPTGAPSSSKKPRVLFGSTGMPGAMVEVKVIFLRYRPLAAAGLSLITSSIAAE